LEKKRGRKRESVQRAKRVRANPEGLMPENSGETEHYIKKQQGVRKTNGRERFRGKEEGGEERGGENFSTRHRGGESGKMELQFYESLKNLAGRTRGKRGTGGLASEKGDLSFREKRYGRRRKGTSTGRTMPLGGREVKIKGRKEGSWKGNRILGNEDKNVLRRVREMDWKEKTRRKDRQRGGGGEKKCPDVQKRMKCVGRNNQGIHHDIRI